LAVLRDLDNADKYRRLNPVLIAPTSLSAYRGHALTVVRVGIQQTPAWSRTITPLAQGSTVIRATLPPGVSNNRRYPTHVAVLPSGGEHAGGSLSTSQCPVIKTIAFNYKCTSLWVEARRCCAQHVFTL
jgi:hypothetical protein